MKIGSALHTHACKSDGTVYRKWTGVIERVETNCIVTTAPVGSLMFSKGKYYKTKQHMRAYYWLDKYYNLIEFFTPAGILREIYLNIASFPEIEGDILRFKDHELDVSKIPPRKAEIVDEDEFLQASEVYHYSKEFQEKMYAAAREALEVADHWVAHPAPKFRGDHVK